MVVLKERFIVAVVGGHLESYLFAVRKTKKFCQLQAIMARKLGLPRKIYQEVFVIGSPPGK